jgi:guanylate kinase
MIVLLDGPSASGKTTLVQGLLAAYPEQLEFCRRLTTRAPRPEEHDNDFRDYDFVSSAQFQAAREAGRLALYREFDFGMSYGLPLDAVQEVLRRQKSVLALVDLGTAPAARELWPECICILLCSPLEQLERRLRDRGTHSEEQIAERLGNAAEVLRRVPEYDYVVINRGSLQDALEQLRGIVKRHLKPLHREGAHFADGGRE